VTGRKVKGARLLTGLDGLNERPDACEERLDDLLRDDRPEDGLLVDERLAAKTEPIGSRGGGILSNTARSVASASTKGSWRAHKRLFDDTARRGVKRRLEAVGMRV
jgi:hypothetical protein